MPNRVSPTAKTYHLIDKTDLERPVWLVEAYCDDTELTTVVSGDEDGCGRERTIFKRVIVANITETVAVENTLNRNQETANGAL